MNKQQILDELYKFDESLIGLGESIMDNRMEILESKIGYVLPSSFKSLLKIHNYISLGGTEINGIGSEFRGNSLDVLYDFEHFEVGNPMPKEIFPFSADGFGNHYCFDLSEPENDQVLFWQHDFDYTDKSEIEICSDSFYDWVKEEMIDWLLEDTNYDGTEKE